MQNELWCRLRTRSVHRQTSSLHFACKPERRKYTLHCVATSHHKQQEQGNVVRSAASSGLLCKIGRFLSPSSKVEEIVWPITSKTQAGDVKLPCAHCGAVQAPDHDEARRQRASTAVTRPRSAHHCNRTKGCSTGMKASSLQAQTSYTRLFAVPCVLFTSLLLLVGGSEAQSKGLATTGGKHPKQSYDVCLENTNMVAGS